MAAAGVAIVPVEAVFFVTVAIIYSVGAIYFLRNLSNQVGGREGDSYPLGTDLARSKPELMARPS